MFSPQTVGFGFSWLGNLFGVDQMSGPPVALDEPPRPGHVDSVPRVSEAVVLEADPGLVAR